MTELDLLVDLHKNGKRQGPGSKKESLRALEITRLQGKKNIKIADIGCGTGSQTLCLAQKIDGQIIAVDLFPTFLEELENRSEILGLESKIETMEASMDSLPFKEEEFDLIWSEGAIYIIGFENGIKKWKQLLKKGGYLAISEVTWLTKFRPKEIEDFWKNEYPEIDSPSNKIKVLEDNGYTLVGYFPLEVNSWIENYYKPLESRFTSFLRKHNNSELAKKVVKEHKAEFKLYQKYKDYFTYGFYIARRDK